MPKKGTAPPQRKKKSSKEEQFYPDEEQGILPEETADEKKAKMKVGEEDEDIYSPEGREAEVEEYEIEPWEEGFMEGASGPGQWGKDALTGKPLMDVEDVVEAEIDGKQYRFSNRQNAEKFRRKKEDEKRKGRKS